MPLIISTAKGLSSVDTSSGNLIKAYKQSENISHGAVALQSAAKRASSLLSIQKDKPILHHYALRKEGIVKRIVMPAKMDSLAASPNGQWLAAGSQNGSLYIWNLQSGALKTLFSEAHFQALKCLVWSKDSCVLASGGDDARVMLWRMADLSSQGGMTPKFVFTTHSLPITSCNFSFGSFREARLYTASLDATVSVFDVFSGRLLYTIASDSPINAMVVDPAERAIYLGARNGVHVIPLYYEPENAERLTSVGSVDGSVVSTNEFARVLNTSSITVTALALSTDASHLFVGCEDGSVSSWEVGSAQMVKKYRSTRGKVTDLIYIHNEFGSADEFSVLPMLQHNLSPKNESLDFVPTIAIPERDPEKFGDTDETELKKIESSKAAVPGVNSEVSNTDEAQDSVVCELNDLKCRHEQLKKMYDALWARHTSK